MLSGCEAELQELMKQIDCMVQQKKMDWERERQQLQARLDVRQQEYEIQKATLEQKHQEVQSCIMEIYVPLSLSHWSWLIVGLK